MKIETEADLRAALRRFDKFFLAKRPRKDVPREELEEIMAVGISILDFCMCSDAEIPADILGELSMGGRQAVLLTASKMIADYLSRE